MLFFSQEWTEKAPIKKEEEKTNQGLLLSRLVYRFWFSCLALLSGRWHTGVQRQAWVIATSNPTTHSNEGVCLFFYYLSLFSYIHVVPVCIYVCALHVWVSGCQKVVPDPVELQLWMAVNHHVSSFWKLNSEPLEEQPALLTISAASAIQNSRICFSS